MSNPELLVEQVATPGILAAKLLLPFGSAEDPAGARGAHDLLASLLSRGCGNHNNLELADLVEGCGAGLRCSGRLVAPSGGSTVSGQRHLHDRKS